MAVLTVTSRIAAPQDRVFQLASDFANAAATIQGITKVEMLTAGPVRVGTRFRETRMMFGREGTEEMEVLEYAPDRSYALGAESCGCRYRSEFLFAAAEGGAATDVTVTFESTPLTLMAKVMGLLMRPMMTGTVRKCLRADLADLEDVARAEVPRRGDDADSARTGS